MLDYAGTSPLYYTANLVLAHCITWLRWYSSVIEHGVDDSTVNMLKIKSYSTLICGIYLVVRGECDACNRYPSRTLLDQTDTIWQISIVMSIYNLCIHFLKMQRKNAKEYTV